MPETNGKLRIDLEYWRKRRELTMTELANKSKVDRANLYKIESGENKSISLDVLSRLCETLGCSPGELIRTY